MKTPLTKEEKARIPFVKAVIRKSKDEYISGRTICSLIEKHHPLSSKMTGERLRKMLHYARLNETNKKKVIIASRGGYKYSSDRREITNYIISLMDRADAIVSLSKAIKRAI